MIVWNYALSGYWPTVGVSFPFILYFIFFTWEAMKWYLFCCYYQLWSKHDFLMLTICSLIFQIIIQAGLLKKGLCSVQDESAGQLLIFSHRRNAYKAVISKISFPFFCILLGTLAPALLRWLTRNNALFLCVYVHVLVAPKFLCMILLCLIEYESLSSII